MSADASAAQHQASNCAAVAQEEPPYPAPKEVETPKTPAAQPPHSPWQGPPAEQEQLQQPHPALNEVAAREAAAPRPPHLPQQGPQAEPQQLEPLTEPQPETQQEPPVEHALLRHGPPREPLPDEADGSLDHAAVAAEAEGVGEPGAADTPTRGLSRFDKERMMVRKAALVVGQNPIIGTDQSTDIFWAYVGAMVRRTMGRDAKNNGRSLCGLPDRADSAIKREFKEHISKKCQTFEECWLRLKRIHLTGNPSDEDLIEAAKAAFEVTDGCKAMQGCRKHVPGLSYMDQAEWGEPVEGAEARGQVQWGGRRGGVWRPRRR